MKLKAYVSHNYDGRRQAMVAAPNMKVAAQAMGATPQSLRDYGWSFAQDADAELAISRPGKLFFKPISSKATALATWEPA